MQLEIPVGSPNLKNSIRELSQSPSRALWESFATLKSSITGRISAPSMQSESASGAASVWRWCHSEHCRAQHEQHAVLIFSPHTARQSSSTRLGAVKCLQSAPLPPQSPVARSLIRCPCVKNQFLRKTNFAHLRREFLESGARELWGVNEKSISVTH